MVSTLFRLPALLGAALCLAVSASAAARGLPDFTRLVEDNTAAVVNIGTTLKEREADLGRQFQFPDLPEESPLHDFFRRFFGEGGGIPRGVEPRSSLGSGFIISADGYVISNYHVIKDATEVVVRLSDRREFVAEIVGTDERSDLAVLKIDAKDLPSVRIGRSAELKVGEWVLAIGSPFGFEHSVTAGIVSAKGRSLPSENYVPFIQTDVAINPGNSGGPLFNLDGEVVGVNSQIYSRTGGFMGVSFAIPIDVVMNVYGQLRDKGRVSRGWLGVLIQDVTRELAESFGMKKPHGALISRVLPDGPAAKAGLEAGDIVVEFNGREIQLSAELPPVVGASPVGEKVPVVVIREGKRRTLMVAVGELPEDAEIALAPTAPAIASETRLNISVKDLSDAERAQVQEDEAGVMVEKVEAGPAQRAGIRQGDIILMLDNQKVGSAKEFKERVATLPPGKSVPVLIQRRGGPIFLAIRMPDQ